jgi:phosphate-selective porin OprO/OprP
MTKKQALLTAALAALAGVTGTAATMGVAAAQTATSPPPPVTVQTRWNGAPETREEDRRFRVNGRLMYDIASTDADCSNAACTGVNEEGVRSYFRRAFLGVEGRLTEQWRYNIKFDFAISGNVSLDDAYLEYAGQDWSAIIGNNNAIAAMEDRDSSLNIPFNERSFIVTGAGWGKRPGIAWLTNGGNWSLGAALQSNDQANTSDTAANGTEAYFIAARGTWAPIYQQTPEGTTVLHLGASVRQRDIGDGAGNTFGGLFTYAPGALSNKSNNNATVGGSDSDLWLGAEGAFQWNAFGFEAEYAQISTQDVSGNATAFARQQAADADITGYYVDLFWSPTGESRNYRASDGSWAAVRPLRTLGSDGGIGHILLSARYEDWDATDNGFDVVPEGAVPTAAQLAAANAADRRSELTAYTLGLTWVPIEHVKFQLNWSNTEIDYVDNTSDISTTAGAQTLVDNEIQAVTFRTQLDW